MSMEYRDNSRRINAEASQETLHPSVYVSS
jgi:hypothetical protein